MKKVWLFLVSLVIISALAVGYFLFGDPAHSKNRTVFVVQFIRNPDLHKDWKIAAGARCGSAPFAFPTDGMVGYLWDDSFEIGHRHQGIDIFGGTQPGITPVYAAYDGYLTRLSTWKSAVIIRIPSDPLHPGTQIWTYYAHMANADGSSLIAADFAPGTSEKFIKAGTFLGFMGDYSGDPNSPTGIHLHFSIDKDDGSGHFTNELQISNTLDPSPYFGLPLNATTNPTLPILCPAENSTPNS
jgi:murein DD-endopeptidase MepM/ murein hydrolase activator NlpD